MPLSLPVYFRGRTFVLHTRINGRQFKRSLKTADPRVATLRAIQLLRAAQMAGDLVAQKAESKADCWAVQMELPTELYWEPHSAPPKDQQ